MVAYDWGSEDRCPLSSSWGFPNMGGTLCAVVPLRRTIPFWGILRVPPCFWKYPPELPTQRHHGGTERVRESSWRDSSDSTLSTLASRWVNVYLEGTEKDDLSKVGLWEPVRPAVLPPTRTQAGGKLQEKSCFGHH